MQAGREMTLTMLAEIEAIKRLKARYFRYMDTKMWDRWADLFTEDCTLHNPGKRAEPLRGRRQIVETVSANMVGVISVHHGHMPEIEIIDAQTARGIWAMYDRLMGPANGGAGRALLEGYGHYIEDYRKDDSGQWRIARLELRRLQLEISTHDRNTDPAAFPD